MGTRLQEKLAAFPPERQERIRAETARLQAEYMTMQDVRKAREMTQVRMAEILGKSQVTVAQMEKRTGCAVIHATQLYRSNGRASGAGGALPGQRAYHSGRSL